MSTNQPFPIPGKKITEFNFIPLGSHPIHNVEKKLDESPPTSLIINLLSAIPSLNNNGQEIIMAPIVSATLPAGQSELQLSFMVFNNYTNPIKADEVSINQNFTIGLDGKRQLNFYISYKKSDKTFVDTFRADLITFKSIPTTSPLETESILPIQDIDEVKGFFINTNPTASRGTTTTVKPTN